MKESRWRQESQDLLEIQNIDDLARTNPKILSKLLKELLLLEQHPAQTKEHRRGKPSCEQGEGRSICFVASFRFFLPRNMRSSLGGAESDSTTGLLPKRG